MHLKTLLQGIGLGAGLMYLWDPQRGRRRRADILDQVDHAKHCVEDFADKAQRDFGNRASGVAAEASAMWKCKETDDRVLSERVRSKLGRYCSHPHAITVQAEDRHVLVSGPVLADEADGLMHAIRRVRGVRSVEDRLERFQERGDVAALQGGHAPVGEAPAFMQDNWSPATRAVAQLAGIGLMSNCLARRNLTSMLLGTAGFGLFVRATTNRSIGELAGTASCPQPMRLQRSVTIHASLEKVWDFLSDFQQVGAFMPSVREVHDLGNGHYRWSMQLPGGKDLQLEEKVTESIPQERLTWKSVPDSPVAYHGTVTLQQEQEDVTRVNVDLHYTPPGGSLASGMGSLFGVDAESKFQEAVMRIKPFLETGHAPRDVKTPQHSGQPEQTGGA